MKNGRDLTSFCEAKIKDAKQYLNPSSEDALSKRQEKRVRAGFEIFQKITPAQVRTEMQSGDNGYLVMRWEGKKKDVYDIILDSLGIFCDCYDSNRDIGICKHKVALMLWVLQNRKKIT